MEKGIISFSQEYTILRQIHAVLKSDDKENRVADLN